MMGGGRQVLIATVIAGVLATSGASAIALAVVAQTPAPQPPLSAAAPVQPPAVPDAITVDRSPSDPPPEAVEPVLPASLPVAVDIPAIGVHSSLQHLGLTAEHTVEVPAPGPKYDEVAWYRYSSTPGSPGPAVLLGHVDSAANGPSVFFRLGDLRTGDEVLVTREDGLVAVFKVDGVSRHPKDDFPTQLVYGETDHAALRLITCGGAFDRATGHYLDNVVVFASLVGSQ